MKLTLAICVSIILFSGCCSRTINVICLKKECSENFEKLVIESLEDK